MNQFGKVPGRAQFGQRANSLPKGGRRTASSSAGPSELSPQAQAFLEAQRGRTSDPTSGGMNFASAAISGEQDTTKYGEKPVAWIRIISYLVDSLIMGVPYAIIAWPMFVSEMDAPVVSPGGKVVGQVAGSAGGELVVWKYLLMYSALRCIYSIALESSSLQATFGKMMCGLIVTDKDMAKPSLGGVIMRNTLGRLVLNILPFSIGYWMLAFNPQKKGLHDMMGGTLVCRKGSAPSETYSRVFA